MARAGSFRFRGHARQFEAECFADVRRPGAEAEFGVGQVVEGGRGQKPRSFEIGTRGRGRVEHSEARGESSGSSRKLEPVTRQAGVIVVRKLTDDLLQAVRSS